MTGYDEKRSFDSEFGKVYGWVLSNDNGGYTAYADTYGTTWLEVGTAVSIEGAWAIVMDWLRV